MIAVMKRPPSQLLTPLRAVTAAGSAAQILAGFATRGAAARETDFYSNCYDHLIRRQGPRAVAYGSKYLAILVTYFTFLYSKKSA